MERLTFDDNFCDIAQCGLFPCKFENGCSQKQMWERLKAYEDAGITPEAAAHARQIEDGLNEAGYSTARMVEVMKADKEGRVAILPCKVGGDVYSTLDDFGRLHQCRVSYVHIDERSYLNIAALEPVDYEGAQYGATFGSFGKTVFLTREEAGKALEATNGSDLSVHD